ncbi:LysR family transcriptional regulator [Streptomonospora nanhaiensis]|uniref:DNA-binding transcriptional LysR family regulator n=1 Tax=Streptomonospora nanhaiensis TaxID=1323731 RepID=A0A853BHC3_9ACTN|nr:LysR family transcriptional regulator [Streptomonospora nanhaiensis]MBV2364394.1 LysR family transcriptional regulator [Streptomonospora nanhaiensis]MBX9388462.1 LysR family transcriptional regulator [Streptomonospora nanhaiensis]NYI94021.1 DNA-binding transcriptional LysR family regulator [Streptomonospora nanhaiensis]
MIDVRRLQLLQALDQHQTVAGTAEALGVTPSAVSQQLAALAKETGVALVERQGRRFLLTGAARVLLSHADVIFAELERAQADLAEYAEGKVGVARVGSFATAISDLVGPAVAALRQTLPGWRFEIVQAEPEHSTEMLRSGHIDIAVTQSSGSLPPPGSPEFQMVPLMVEPFDAVLPYQHPLAARADLDLAADLADADWILSAPGTPWYDCVTAACHQAGFQPRVRHTVHEFSAVFGLVQAGLGVALMPRLAWTGLPTPQVVVRTVRDTARRHIIALARAGYNAEPFLAAVREAAAKVPVPSVDPLLMAGPRVS